MYICDLSRSVGAGSATTRNTRGLTRSVIRLIVPPFPAVSRPSNTTQILAPDALTHSCMATSSPCRILIWRSYSLRFIFGGGPAPASSPATDDDARVSASSRSRSPFFFLAISLPPINAVTWRRRRARAADEEHLGAEVFGLALYAELLGLPVARLRVHDHVRVAAGGRAAVHRLIIGR